MVPDNKVGNALECPVRLLKRKEPEKDDSDTERMTKPHDSMNQFRCPVLRPTPHSSVQSGPVLRPKPICSDPVFGKRRLVNIQIQGSRLSENNTETSTACDPEPISGSAILPERIVAEKWNSLLGNSRKLLSCLGGMELAFDADFSGLRVNP